MSSLQYRRYTLPFRSSLPYPRLRFPSISVGNFQLFISSPSSMYPRTRSYLLLILLGSLSVPLRSIHLSLPSPVSLRRLH
jgi:hypothetical protein